MLNKLFSRLQHSTQSHNKIVKPARLLSQAERVALILSSATPPSVFDDENIFQKLQAEYKGVPEYGYDKFSTWSRAVDRARNLIVITQINELSASVLDAACGDGMAGRILADYGHDVRLADLADWRDPRAKNIPFIQADFCKHLAFPDNHFDVISSYNAFEHFEAPARALAEFVRICKPGGYVFLEFGPLYASPWGLHAYRMLKMPYPQFLFSKEFIQSKLHEIGVQDLNQQLTELQHMNEWTPQQFKELWLSSSCDIIKEEQFVVVEEHLDLIERFAPAFTGRGLVLEDVTIQATRVLLKKLPQSEICSTPLVFK